MADAAQNQRPRPAPWRRLWRLRNWRIRTRLAALIVLPTVTFLVFSGLGLASNLDTAASYQRTLTLARLGQRLLTTTGQLESEQTAAAASLSGSSQGSGATAGVPTFASASRAVDGDLPAVRSAANQVAASPAYPAQTRDDARTVLYRLGELPSLRDAVLHSHLPAQIAVQKYSTVVTDLLGMIATTSGQSADPTLTSWVHTVGTLADVQAELATQRALVTADLVGHAVPPGGESALSQAIAAQSTDLDQFTASATSAQANRYAYTVTGSHVAGMQATLNRVVSSGGSWVGSPPAGTLAAWSTDSSGTIGEVNAVAAHLAGAITARAGRLHTDQIDGAVGAGVVALAVLVAILLATILVARSLSRPLRRLRADALTVATKRLPALVDRLRTEDPNAVPLTVPPLGVDTADEIGEVARAFDAVHREATRLAGEEARLRANWRTVFVNLARRSQTLVDSQLGIIDELERSERDDGRLARLFRLDHLATRMRRHGENLLVLGGHDPARRWDEPLPLVDVLRAAVSEVEKYDRVDVRDGTPSRSVRAEAVSDVVHLVAELIDNATAYSPPGSRVLVVTGAGAHGSTTVEVTDRGVGLSDDECDFFNARLADPPTEDAEVSRRMGLFVVARLARRQGVTVRLRPAADVGLTGVVTLPARLVVDRDAERPPAAMPGPGPDPGRGWLGDRWARALAMPGPGAASWFGSEPLDPRPPPGTGDAPGVVQPGGAAPQPVRAPARSTDPVAPAAAVRQPVADGVTAAGLPRRRPGANYVAGATRVPSGEAAPSEAATSGPGPGGADGPGADLAPQSWEATPEAIRRRFAALQSGTRRARHAGQAREPGTLPG